MGKSPIRIQQGWMLGIPCVGSALTYGDTISQVGGGYVAVTNNDWYAYLSKLVKNEDIRREIGERGRAYAYENLTLEKHIHLWNETYATLVRGQGK